MIEDVASNDDKVIVVQLILNDKLILQHVQNEGEDSKNNDDDNDMLEREGIKRPLTSHTRVAIDTTMNYSMFTDSNGRRLRS